MKIRLLFLAVLLLTGLQSFAQYVGKAKDFAEFTKRPLLVVLPEIKDGSDIKSVVKMKEVIKSSFSGFWTLQKQISFLSQAEFKAMKKNKKKEAFAVVSFPTVHVAKGSFTPNGPRSMGSPTQFKYETTASFDVNLMLMGLSEDALSNDWIYSHPFATDYPTEGNMASTLLLAQNIVVKGAKESEEISFPKEAKENASKLKNLTLLIDKAKLGSNVTEQEIKAAYGLPFKVVETSVVDDAILNKTPGFAYVYMLPNSAGGKNLQLQLVLDTDKSQVISVSMPATFRVGNIRGKEIKEGNLKDYVSYIKN
ncbi:hypothetical protein [Rufibacter hautae]|uniref:Uncharacterized protein n=1 Tax=Rufibacter hautae TaxID=2595005 RepID=A0A5B6T8G9_9BACT|nr:hypothetical protein [Rufibacter hautae]KAA3436458.1 hypothetical protein FOA19_18890 [Rufibacter hautae]